MAHSTHQGKLIRCNPEDLRHVRARIKVQLRSIHPNPGPSRNISVLTQNMSGPTSIPRWIHYLQFFQRQDADIVFLSEFRFASSYWESSFHEAAKKHGYCMIHNNSENTNGVAILANTKITSPASLRKHVSLDGDKQCRWIRTKIHLGTNLLNIVACYGDGRKGTAGKENRQSMVRKIRLVHKEQAIIAGDWNTIIQPSDVSNNCSTHNCKYVTAISATMMDCSSIQHPLPQHTRIRGYPGTSRVDRILMTHKTWIDLTPTSTHTLTVPPGEVDNKKINSPDHDAVQTFLTIQIKHKKQIPRSEHPCRHWKDKQEKEFQEEVTQNIAKDIDNIPQEAKLQYILQQTRLAAKIFNPPPEMKAHTTNHDLNRSVKFLRSAMLTKQKYFFKSLRGAALSVENSPDPDIPPNEMEAFTTMKHGCQYDSHTPKLDATPGLTPANAHITAMQIRQAVRQKKHKAADVDGNHGYLIAMLPDILLQIIADSISQNPVPLWAKRSAIFLIYKDGNPKVPSSWRPITIIHVIQRIMEKLVKADLTTATEYNLGPEQAGFRPGLCCQMQLLRLHHTKKRMKCQHTTVFMDVKKAYDSVSWALVIQTIQETAPNSQLSQFVQQIYDPQTPGETVAYLTSGTTDPFQITHGIKQGGPLSPQIFAMIYEKVMRSIRSPFRRLRAYILLYADDILIVAPNDTITQAAHILTQGLEKVGLMIHPGKTKAMSTNPTNLIIQDQKIQHVPFMKYLGIFVSDDPLMISRSVKDETLELLLRVMNKPITAMARLQYWNKVITPIARYRMSTSGAPPDLPIWFDQQATKLLGQVVGFPAKVSRKTLRDRQTGIGIINPADMADADAIDNMNKCLQQYPLEYSLPKSYFNLCNRWSIQIHSDKRLPVFTPPNLWNPSITHVQTKMTHTYCPSFADVACDGSFVPLTGVAAGAAILPDGTAYIARVPGKQLPYRAELVGAILASRLAPNGAKIKCDCKSVVLVGNRSKKTIKHFDLTHPLQQSIADKHQTLEWTRGHDKQPANLAAHLAADEAVLNAPIVPSTSTPSQPGEMSYDDHPILRAKEAIQLQTPQHTHDEIHPTSFKPLRKRWDDWNSRVSWYFAAVQIPTYAFYIPEWYNNPPKECNKCQGNHGLSTARVLAHCHQSPLQQHYTQAWPSFIHPTITQWWDKADEQEKFLCARLLIPTTLAITIKNNHKIWKITQHFLKNFKPLAKSLRTWLVQDIPEDAPKSKRLIPYSIWKHGRESQ